MLVFVVAAEYEPFKNMLSAFSKTTVKDMGADEFEKPYGGGVAECIYDDHIPRDDDNVCGKKSYPFELWQCSRPKGHTGMHECNLGQITRTNGVARWRDRPDGHVPDLVAAHIGDYQATEALRKTGTNETAFCLNFKNLDWSATPVPDALITSDGQWHESETFAEFQFLRKKRDTGELTPVMIDRLEWLETEWANEFFNLMGQQPNHLSLCSALADPPNTKTVVIERVW